MRGGATRSYPSFPEIEDDIEYNPARFLDVRVGGDGIGDISDLATAWALIRGIQDIATIRAWITVEVELGRGRNGGPRRCVIKRLNRRQLQIEEPAETTHSPKNAARDPHDREKTTHTTDSEIDTSDEATDSEVDESTTADSETTITASVAASDTPSTPSSMSTSADPALATDGGTVAPPTPRCSDCRGELQREEVADEVAYWCAPCGGFREPVEAATELEAR